MAFGSSSGLATVPNGRWRIMVQRPQRNIVSFISCAVSGCLTGSPCVPSDSTTTSITLRFSPLTTAFTTPPIGEVKRMRSSFLSQNNASPTATLSPSVTSKRGVSPTKSTGFTAYVAIPRISVTCFSAAPPIGMSRPFFILIISDIMSNCLSISLQIYDFYFYFDLFVYLQTLFYKVKNRKIIG